MGVLLKKCLIITNISRTCFTAPGDYDAGPYTVMFTAGQASAILMVPTNNDNFTEMTEDLKVMLVTTSMPSLVQPGDPDTSYIAINDNEPSEFDLQHVVVACWHSPVSTDFNKTFHRNALTISYIASLPKVVHFPYMHSHDSLAWSTAQILAIASFSFYIFNCVNLCLFH